MCRGIRENWMLKFPYFFKPEVVNTTLMPKSALCLEATTKVAHGYFKEQLVQGIAAGEIAPDVDPDIGAFILESTFNNVGRHLMAQAAVSPAELLELGAAAFASEDMQMALDQVISILERGFKAK